MSKFKAGDVVRFDFKQFKDHSIAVKFHYLLKSFQFIVKNVNGVTINVFDLQLISENWHSDVFVKVEPNWEFPKKFSKFSIRDVTKKQFLGQCEKYDLYYVESEYTDYRGFVYKYKDLVAINQRSEWSVKEIEWSVKEIGWLDINSKYYEKKWIIVAARQAFLLGLIPYLNQEKLRKSLFEDL